MGKANRYKVGGSPFFFSAPRGPAILLRIHKPGDTTIPGRDLGLVLMANNVYLIAVPEDERALSRAIGEANERYSQMRNFAKGETRVETA